MTSPPYPPPTSTLVSTTPRLTTASGKRDRALLLIGFVAAQRRSEIAALTTNDIARQDAGLLLRI
ncbi:hypothetical protein ACTXJ9_11270 [Brachybacterium tyrofermentans]|uniref:hypothetical protein n=1 Tax=Brachybacterium tyrofermentans TaxID=47848 RepID=UPI003FD4BD6A